jgi:molybdenum cofactor biosynthesis enzyme MoaA
MTVVNKSKVAVGVVPTHLKFVGSLVPDDNGKLPRTRSGILKVVSGMRAICKSSPVKLKCVQVPLFPGADSKDLQDLFKGMKALKLEVHLIMMVGGAKSNQSQG